jgi:hypothetical protein
MRLGRPQVSEFLHANYLVMVTGSKFFTGQPFCGALLVPASLSKELAARDRLPKGLRDYATRSDFPVGWDRIRSNFAPDPNLGEWLRWETALEEMRNYYALPLAYRKTVLAGLAKAIPKIIGAVPELELVPEYDHVVADADEEFAYPTIFPFLIRHGAGHLDSAAVVALYRALNRDMTKELAIGEPWLAARPCHLGQPVSMRQVGSSEAAALRIAIGSRTLFEAWSVGDDAANRAIRTIAADVAAVVRKIAIVLRHQSAERFTPQGMAAKGTRHAI